MNMDYCQLNIFTTILNFFLYTIFLSVSITLQRVLPDRPASETPKVSVSLITRVQQRLRAKTKALQSSHSLLKNPVVIITEYLSIVRTVGVYHAVGCTNHTLIVYVHKRLQTCTKIRKTGCTSWLRLKRGWNGRGLAQGLTMCHAGNKLIRLSLKVWGSCQPPIP